MVPRPASAGLRAAEADALGRQLGLVVKLDAVRHLRPGVVLYDGIELADPETGQTILRSRCLEVAWRRQKDGQGQLRPTLCVIASQPEVETAAIGVAWRWVQRLLENSPGRLEANVQISADAVTLLAGDRSQTMTEVAALLESTPGRSSAQIDFRLVGADTPEPACIRIVRNREVSPPASRFELSTGDGELPCSVLALAIDELKPLGPAMPLSWAGLGQRDAGRLGRGSRPGNWPTWTSAASSPIIFRIASAASAARRSPRPGFAAAGSKSAAECSPPSTARSAVRSWPLPSIAWASSPVPSRFRRATESRIGSWRCRSCSMPTVCGFAVSARTAEPGTILSDGRNRLLGESSRGSQPMAALVQTLVPQSVVQVPASRQTDWLLASPAGARRSRAARSGKHDADRSRASA